MNKVFQIALREIIVTVLSKAFLFGLLVMPAMIGVFALIAPRVFNFQNFKVEGEVRIIDHSGALIPELRTTLEERKDAARQAEEFRQAVEKAPAAVRDLAANAPAAAIQSALGPVPEIALVEKSVSADIQVEKAWLLDEKAEQKPLALVVVSANAVVRDDLLDRTGRRDAREGRDERRGLLAQLRSQLLELVVPESHRGPDQLGPIARFDQHRCTHPPGARRGSRHYAVAVCRRR
jgi:hypothetical protein